MIILILEIDEFLFVDGIFIVEVLMVRLILFLFIMIKDVEKIVLCVECERKLKLVCVFKIVVFLFEFCKFILFNEVVLLLVLIVLVNGISKVLKVFSVLVDVNVLIVIGDIGIKCFGGIMILKLLLSVRCK